MFTLPTIYKKKGKPLYIALYEELKNSIIHHDLNPGEKLPSKRNLATSMGVSLKTVENAYNQLLLEGYVYAEEKKGIYVADIGNFRVEELEASKKYETRYRQTYYKVNLRSNQNAPEDFPENVWCRMVREVLSESPKELFTTTPFNGLYELRKEIADHLQSFRGMKVSVDQIIVGAGTEYMYGRLSQILGQDVVYGLPEPSSIRLRELFQNNRLPYELIANTQNGLNLEELYHSYCNVIHISPAHQYPLGTALLLPERLALLEWVNQSQNRYIIEDDYDSEYVVNGRPIPPLFSIDIRGKVIYMNTFSKTVFPAVRISYMVLPECLMDKYLKSISFYSSIVPSLEQYALAKFIQNKHLDRLIHRINHKNMLLRTYLLKCLEVLIENGKVSVISGESGTHILLKLHTEWKDAEIKKRLRDESVMVGMLSEYYEKPPKEHEKTLVVNYSGLREEQIDYFVEQLVSLLRD